MSRRASAGLNVAQELGAQGKLDNAIVIALGINGTFSQSTGQKLIDYLGTERKIFWVTGYGKTISWQDEVNSTIRILAEANDNLSIIDWAGLVKGHPEWLYSDGVHLKFAGRTAYVDTIYTALGLSKK